MVKFGVLGAGRIAQTFCSAVIGINEHLYAVSSRDLTNAETFKKTYGFQKAYGSYEEMLSDPEVDCVYVATPHGMHFEHMKLCLEHGKHVLCEKAFTLNKKQAEQIFQLADKQHLFVMEAMWTRFLPTIQEVKRIVDSGLIGEVIQLEANFCFMRPIDPINRLFNKELGGGALLDIGIYPLTLANLILGIPDSFESVVTLADTGVDITEKITYFYPRATAVFNVSLVSEMPHDAYIYGTSGYIRIPNFHAADAAVVYNNNHKTIREIEHKHLVNGLEYEVFETVKCIRKHVHESEIMSHAMTLEILDQMDKLRATWGVKYPQE